MVTTDSALNDLKNKLSELLPAERALFDEPLSRHCTWGVGGPAACLLTVDTLPELTEALRLIEDAAVPYFILGKGSNLLAPDEGYAGVVISLKGEFLSLSIDESRLQVTAGAGIALPVLARECGRSGYAGLEPLGGIPGSLGGAVRMNAGAFGTQISDIATGVSWLSMPGAVLSEGLPGFSYRRCDLPAAAIVTSVTLRLRKDAQQDIDARMKEYADRRAATQPKGRSAGSVFRNPDGASAGALLDSAGCKGLAAGGATVSERHANFIMTSPEATAADVMALIRAMRERVRAAHGVELLPEVTVLRTNAGTGGAGGAVYVP